MGRIEALQQARGQGLDLVEVAALATPPVAKIIDFKKFLYQQEKKRREEKKKARVSETKEVRLGPFMNNHDLAVMIRRAREFLSSGDKVRYVVRFFGRQMAHPEFGREVLHKAIAAVSDVSKVEREAHLEGKQLIALLTPQRSKKHEQEKNQESDSKAV